MEKLNLIISNDEKFIKFVKDIVAAFYGTDTSVYDSNSRKSEAIKVKHLAMYICRTELKASTLKVGKMFKVDHSTVVYIEKKFNGYLTWDYELKSDLAKILNMLKFQMADELNLSKDYYYIPLNDFVSVRLTDGKAIILKGFTEKDIEHLKFIDSRNGQEIADQPIKYVKHTNQKYYILEKNEKNNG